MNIKRTIIAAVVGLTLVALVAPGVAQGVTIEELLVQIAQLQAQLVALQQAQGGTGTVGTVPAACVGVTFTRALVDGSTGSDVKCLQAILNLSATTRVAATGAGSPGSETLYFGPLTLVAVKTYQAEHGWAPANQVGPMTRAALNASLASGTTGGTTTPTAGCPTGAVYNSVTGALCPVAGTPTGAEGSITVTKSVTPSSGVEMNVGQSNVAVAAIDVKATSSDVVVNRVDVNFTGIATSGGTALSCNVRPWLNISSITVSDGTTSKSLAVTQANTTEVTVGTTYSLRVEGLAMLVSKDTTKKITLSVAPATLPVGATSCTPTIQFGQNAVRGTDGAGISQTGPTAALTTSTFVVKTGDTGTLTVSTSSDSPKARNVMVQEAAQTTDVVLMKFNVKAKNNDVILRTVLLNVLSSSGTLSTVMPTLKLLDGSTELAATGTQASVTAGSSTFEAINLTIPKDTTKTLTVVGTLAKTNTSVITEGTAVSVNLLAIDVDGEDASTYTAVEAGGSNIDAANAYAFLTAPTFALVSQSIANVPGTSGSTTQAATAVIRFNVTATGGDVYIRKTYTTGASSGVLASSTALGASGTVTQTFTTNATEGTNAWKVSAGDTKYFAVTANVANTTDYGSGYFVGMKLQNVKWGTTDVDEDGPNVQTWGMEDIKTDQVYINEVL